MSTRAQRAKRALDLLRKERDPGRVWQAYEGWLQNATRGEIRKHWRKWMGAFPGWAKAVEIGEVS